MAREVEEDDGEKRKSFCQSLICPSVATISFPPEINLDTFSGGVES